MAPSSTVENYLKAIHHEQAVACTPGSLVPVGRIASVMNVVPGTATTMVKGLAEAGLVEYAPYSGVRLTDAGGKLAALVLRRHRLVELFLVKVMGMSWAEVHDEAERLEHAVSDRLIDRMDEMLGRPQVDPHGDPIPRGDGSMPRRDHPSLLTCPLATPVVITRVLDQDAAFLRFVEKNRLKPGERVAVESRSESADSVRVRRAGRARLTLGARAASKLLVEAGAWLLICGLPAWSGAAPVQDRPTRAHAAAHAGPAGDEPTAAQDPHVLRGQVRESRSRTPIVGAVVSLVATPPVQAITDAAGRFELTAAISSPGPLRIEVTAPGFKPFELDLSPNVSADLQVFELEPEYRYTEVVSVSPEARDLFDAYQPTTVLVGQELSRELEATLGATLARQPGIAERSFGPGSSRPVIRGLDGDRILVLEDGQRTGDLSSQSADHGVNVNPAAARRLEVVRGAATLLYGANAIGGLVNVISELIPTARPAHPSGAVTFDGGSGAGQLGVAADVTTAVGAAGWVMRTGGSARRYGNTSTPDGGVPNSGGRTVTAMVALARASADWHLGASYAFDDSRYGIPIVGLGDIRITPRRHNLTMKFEHRRLAGPLESVRGTVAHRRYTHDEIEGGVVATTFNNTGTEVEMHARHRPFSRLSGTWGAWVFTRQFEATGAEALSPPVGQRSVALFAYEEVDVAPLTLQFGARVDHTRFAPSGALDDRRFTNLSGSAGLLAKLRPSLSVAVNLARASRQPALEELYFFGPHVGNFVYERGNGRLDSEHALGLDATVRFRGARVAAEVSTFLNAVDDFIFRQPAGYDIAGLPVVDFVAADARLTGFEGQVEVQLGHGWSSRTSADAVRGTVTSGDTPLPRIPPPRLRQELRFQRGAFTTGGSVVLASRQGRVALGEAPTPGYTLGRLFASHSLVHGRAVSTITLRVDNVTDTLYRNHLSYIRQFVPEMGRSVNVVYGLQF